jgi:hypothetical protein
VQTTLKNEQKSRYFQQILLDISHLSNSTAKLLALYHVKYFVSHRLISFAILHFTVQRDTTGLSAENAELKIRLQAMEQQAQLHDGEHSFF